jgi:hypothetical protein
MNAIQANFLIFQGTFMYLIVQKKPRPVNGKKGTGGWTGSDLGGARSSNDETQSGADEPEMDEQAQDIFLKGSVAMAGSISSLLSIMGDPAHMGQESPCLVRIQEQLFFDERVQPSAVGKI